MLLDVIAREFAGIPRLVHVPCLMVLIFLMCTVMVAGKILEIGRLNSLYHTLFSYCLSFLLNSALPLFQFQINWSQACCFWMWSKMWLWSKLCKSCISERIEISTWGFLLQQEKLLCSFLYLILWWILVETSLNKKSDWFEFTGLPYSKERMGR